jgi:hypothetical protein
MPAIRPNISTSSLALATSIPMKWSSFSIVKPTLQIRVTGEPVHDTVRFITCGNGLVRERSRTAPRAAPDTADPHIAIRPELLRLSPAGLIIQARTDAQHRLRKFSHLRTAPRGATRLPGLQVHRRLWAGSRTDAQHRLREFSHAALCSRGGA